MNIYDVFPSNYLRASDLNGRNFTLTIAEFAIESMGHGAEEEEKPVLTFEGAKKGLVLNKTNAMTIASLYGPDTDNWIGQRITLYPTNVRAFGKMQPAIRVRDAMPPPVAKPEPEQPPAESENPFEDEGPSIEDLPASMG